MPLFSADGDVPRKALVTVPNLQGAKLTSWRRYRWLSAIELPAKFTLHFRHVYRRFRFSMELKTTGHPVSIERMIKKMGNEEGKMVYDFWDIKWWKGMSFSRSLLYYA